VAELERMRASLLRDWCVHAMRTSGTRRPTARAKPRPPLLLSKSASRTSARRSIAAACGSVASIGSGV